MTLRRDTLERFHRVLSGEVAEDGIKRVSRRFRENHQITVGNPLMVDMGHIYGAHKDRVDGKSSPAEADEKTKKIIDGGQT